MPFTCTRRSARRSGLIAGVRSNFARVPEPGPRPAATRARTRRPVPAPTSTPFSARRRPNERCSARSAPYRGCGTLRLATARCRRPPAPSAPRPAQDNTRGLFHDLFGYEKSCFNIEIKFYKNCILNFFIKTFMAIHLTNVRWLFLARESLKKLNLILY